MKTILRGGRVVDPVHDRDAVADVHIDGARIVAPFPDEAADRIVRVDGCLVMAAGIDLHSHIGGGKMVIARELMGEDHHRHRIAAAGPFRAGSGRAVPSSFQTGYAYAHMGYTMAFEPAMLPINARGAHLEMADIPVLDRGAYVLLGNDDLLLELLARGERSAVCDLVGWMLRATRAMAVKLVNPGGIEAFKWGLRSIDLDEAGPHYGLTPRQILTALAEAVDRLGLPHPLHIHGLHLGLPGSAATTRATIEALEGRRAHLTHLQFHAYGREGPKGFSSGAAEIMELLRRHPNISLDVGQVMFGQTVTASADIMSQARNAAYARPKRSCLMDIECEAGCGVVPFRYRHRNFVHALQWVIGLELFLLMDDPWRIALTTDHPNGAPFTTYPELIRLLGERAYREAMLARLPAEVREVSVLADIRREYSLSEIAVITRAGPARLLGLEDRGHLGPGAVADVVVHECGRDLAATFAQVRHLLKAGQFVVENGELRPEATARGGAIHVVEAPFDPAIRRHAARHLEEVRGMRVESLEIGEDELAELGPLEAHRPRRHMAA